VSDLRARERVFGLAGSAEQRISRPRGRDRNSEGGGMSTGGLAREPAVCIA
jgi:hypothetical protein